jgi:hypothetical protein
MYIIMMNIRDIFGKPKEGFHKRRFCTIALYDFVGTLFLSFFFSYLFKIHVFYSIFFFFSLGIFCHYIFDVHTTIHKLLFLR